MHEYSRISLQTNIRLHFVTLFKWFLNGLLWYTHGREGILWGHPVIQRWHCSDVADVLGTSLKAKDHSVISKINSCLPQLKEKYCYRSAPKKIWSENTTHRCCSPKYLQHPTSKTEQHPVWLLNLNESCGRWPCSCIARWHRMIGEWMNGQIEERALIEK